MEKIIIEIVHPLRLWKEYRTFDIPEVRIGRGYDNDLILADPHVSAEHVVIRWEGDVWIAEDVSMENGMYVRKLGKVMDRVHLNSGDEIVIGKTRLRFLAPAHPVAATKSLLPSHGLLKIIARPVNIWSIIIFSCLVFGVHVHLSSSKSMTFLKLVSGSIGFLFMGLAWAGIWAFVGRIIKHHSQFGAQFALSLLFLAFFLFLTNISEYVGYFSNSVALEAVSAALLLGALFTLFLIGNLTVATSVSLFKRIAVCTTISVVIIALMTLLYYTFKDEFSPYPAYYATLKPPFIKTLPTQGLDQFLANTQEIFDFSKSAKGVPGL